MTTPPPAAVTVIDDDPTQLAMLVATIQRGGEFNASGFRQARDGLYYILNNRPAAVVLDLCMPDMDGMEALQRLQISAPEVPVLVLTGLVSPRRDGYLELLRRNGAAACLTKPIGGADLRAAIREAIGARRPPQTDQDSARSTL